MKLEQVMKNRKPRDEMCVERFIDTPKNIWNLNIIAHLFHIIHWMARSYGHLWQFSLKSIPLTKGLKCLYWVL